MYMNNSLTVLVRAWSHVEPQIKYTVLSLVRLVATEVSRFLAPQFSPSVRHTANFANFETYQCQHVTATPPDLETAVCVMPSAVSVSANRMWKVSGVTAASTASST